VNPDHPAIHIAAKAFSDVLGRETVFIRSGGSIPIVGDFKKHLGIPTILMDSDFPTMDYIRQREIQARELLCRIMTIAHFLEQYGQ